MLFSDLVPHSQIDSKVVRFVQPLGKDFLLQRALCPSVGRPLCTSYKVQEDEIRSLDLSEGKLVLDALFSPRKSMLEDTVIWLCWG